MESILTSIKKLLGIAEEYEHFDTDITIHINSSLSVLTQLGVGPSEGYIITGAEETWIDFINADAKTIEMIKSYIYMKVRLLFDPPTNSFLVESFNRQIQELEWRILVAAESINFEGEV